MKTEQMRFWEGDFGDEYTDRNSFDIDELYMKDFGITRSELVKECLKDIPKDARILEVGCNRGLQLDNLKKLGFTNLWGIEINEKALELARQKQYNIVVGSGFDIPFKDGFFDLVFTSGVLIHIYPDDLHKMLKEILRVSIKYIWATEYFSETLQKINYRGHKTKLWKTDYIKEYQKLFSDLKVVYEKKLKYKDNDNIDIMFLLEK